MEDEDIYYLMMWTDSQGAEVLTSAQAAKWANIVITFLESRIMWFFRSTKKVQFTTFTGECNEVDGEPINILCEYALTFFIVNIFGIFSCSKYYVYLRSFPLYS